MTELRGWLAGIGLEKHTESFLKQRIDLDVVGDLTDDELQQLGLLLGERKRLRAAAAALKRPQPEPVSADRQPTQLAEVPASAERRQVTVMFCDLVKSTQRERLPGHRPVAPGRRGRRRLQWHLPAARQAGRRLRG